MRLVKVRRLTLISCVNNAPVKVHIGWIYCEGTPINYPVVQTDDNSYYLKHLFDGTYNNAGCIFLDMMNSPDFTDSNSILYGHNMKNGTMFASLNNYKEQEYYDTYPEILLVTENQNYRIELFAAYDAAVEEQAWDISFSTREEFRQWLDGAVQRSYFSSETVPQPTDRVITFSTCSYEFDNARFVLLGKLTYEDTAEAVSHPTENRQSNLE